MNTPKAKISGMGRIIKKDSGEVIEFELIADTCKSKAELEKALGVVIQTEEEKDGSNT